MRRKEGTKKKEKKTQKKVGDAKREAANPSWVFVCAWFVPVLLLVRFASRLETIRINTLEIAADRQHCSQISFRPHFGGEAAQRGARAHPPHGVSKGLPAEPFGGA